MSKSEKDRVVIQVNNFFKNEKEDSIKKRINDAFVQIVKKNSINILK